MHTGLDHRLDPDAEAQRRAMAQRLRELSPELRPPFGWAELQERSRMRRRMGPSPSRVSWAAAAVAACVTLMLALAAWVHSDPVRRWGGAGASLGSAAVQATARPIGTESMRSRERLERMAAEPYGRAIVRVSTRLAVQDLEDRIASVDDQLTIEQIEDGRAAQLHALQRERARMIDSLARVRYAEMLAAELP
jgi:hypothetical protein